MAGTSLTESEVRPKLEALVNALYQNIPCGVGSTGSVKLSASDEKQVLKTGSQWAVRQGLGEEADLDHTEDGGCLPDADPSEVSERALDRGRKQLGTLGSGNHFLEIGVVDAIFDQDTARGFGLFEGQVTVMLHSGSRGLGYQVCDDYLALMNKLSHKLEFRLADRQLACAMIGSDEGMSYFRAMSCAAIGAGVKRAMKPAEEELKRQTPIGPTGNLRRGIATKAKRYPKTGSAVAIVGYRKAPKGGTESPKSSKRRNGYGKNGEFICFDVHPFRSTKPEHYLKHLGNSRDTFLRLVDKARSYPEKAAQALVADRNYQDLDQLVLNHLMGS